MHANMHTHLIDAKFCRVHADAACTAGACDTLTAWMRAGMAPAESSILEHLCGLTSNKVFNASAATSPICVERERERERGCTRERKRERERERV